MVQVNFETRCRSHSECVGQAETIGTAMFVYLDGKICGSICVYLKCINISVHYVVYWASYWIVNTKQAIFIKRNISKRYFPKGFIYAYE